MEKIKEEMQYCTSCGAANKMSATFCKECNKKIIVRHRPVVDFLKKRVKGKATGEVTERLFSLIKDFLFEHLYGAILTVSVVTSAAITVVTSTPYIENVKEPPSDIAENVVVSENTVVADELKESGVDPEYAHWCELHAEMMMSYYMDYTNYELWAFDGYTVSPDNIPLSEIYAELAIPGFNYQGVHQMMTERVPLGMYHNGPVDRNIGVTELHSFEEYKFGENVSSPLGQTLYTDGYEVMECNYVISLHDGLEKDGTFIPEPVEKEVYKVLFVRYEDSWYIAEEILVDRIKGDTYDIYMQYGPYGIVTTEYDG